MVSCAASCRVVVFVNIGSTARSAHCAPLPGGGHPFFRVKGSLV